MKITFHGAAQTVTGSKHLLETDHGDKILLDCGLFQSLGKETLEMNSHFGFDPRSLDAVVLSHAHIDHSGLLPRLWKEGYRGPIYATPATYDLCTIMLADSAFIQEADIRFVNKRKRSRGQKEIEPLYDMHDVTEVLKLFKKVRYDKEVKINDRIRLTFTDAGHILGAAASHLRMNESGVVRQLTYTADIGRYDSPLLRDPATFPQADVLICESTYGNRLHDSNADTEQQLLDAVLRTCRDKKGKLIIPAFSLGRTQEIVFTLNKLDLFGLLPDIKIFVDSPLSSDATRVMQDHDEDLNDEVQYFARSRPDPFGFGKLFYITEKRDSQQLNYFKEPCIIISASGMAEAGRVKHHIMHNIGDPANSILFAGYAEPQSLAGRLRLKPAYVTIFGEDVKVKAEILTIDSLSAHADYEGILKYLECQNPALTQQVFLVHGSLEAQQFLKEKLHGAGYSKISIPNMHEQFFI